MLQNQLVNVKFAPTAKPKNDLISTRREISISLKEINIKMLFPPTYLRNIRLHFIN